jgi:hypothetical protein
VFVAHSERAGEYGGCLKGLRKIEMDASLITFIYIMKFPVSREQLRNIKKDVEDEIIEYNIEKAVDNIKERIIVHAYYGLSNTKLKVDIPVRLQNIIPDKWRAYIRIDSSAHPLLLFNPYKTHFEVIKGKLIELFPDVTFEIDPLKTYILIDCS